MDAVEIKISPNLERMMKELGDDIRSGGYSGMLNVVESVRAKAIPHTPHKTSNLVNAEQTEVSPNGDRGRVFVDDNAPYGIFVHEGTGLFGPEKKRIVPKHAKALRIPGVGFRRSTKGMKGVPFFAMALSESDPGALYEEGMGNLLRSRGHIK